MDDPSHRLRWKICKTFGRFVDDEEFSNLSREQWLWMNAMISQDENEEFERSRDLVEYLASFWNSEAVKAIQENRESANKHNFPTNQEFDDMLEGKKFKNQQIIEAIKAQNKAKNKTNDPGNRFSDRHSYRKGLKLPTDLSELLKD